MPFPERSKLYRVVTSEGGTMAVWMKGAWYPCITHKPEIAGVMLEDAKRIVDPGVGLQLWEYEYRGIVAGVVEVAANG